MKCRRVMQSGQGPRAGCDLDVFNAYRHEVLLMRSIALPFRTPVATALLAVALASGLSGSLSAAERIDHAGRILGALPTVSTPLLFNTAQADAVVSAMQILPRDNPWNEDISGRPVHADSAALMAQIRADVVAGGASRNTLRVFTEMNYVLVPDSQPLVGLNVLGYPDEADMNGGTSPIATYPLPTTLPIESWPSGRPDGETLLSWQQDLAGDGGDRHSITVQPGAGTEFETWVTNLTGNTPNWECQGAAQFTLTSNALRPLGWTSADAAGLQMFPALIRYDECQRGVISHALRVIVKKSRKEYIYPATHWASTIPASSTQYPAMGQRIRLKPGFTIPSGWTKESKAVAQAFKTYGALVADNGGFFSVSACPDDRFASGAFDDVQTIDINQFEVIQTTAQNAGPRSAGAPTANAGVDLSGTVAGGATLSGSATGTGLTTTWYVYPYTTAPGTVTFGTPAALSTSATFSAAGTYTLMLKASDGVHTPAYDAVVVTVAAANPVPTLDSLVPTTIAPGHGDFPLTLNGTGFVSNATVTWSGQPDLTPTVLSTGMLFVSVPASYVASAGTATITVVNPAPGGGASAAQTFTIVTPDTTPPSITTPATAPGTVSGTSTALSVAASDASALTYTWSVASWSGGDPSVSGVSFTPNGTLGAAASQATFSYAGTYTLQVEVRDAAGNTTSSTTGTITVAQTATAIVIAEVAPLLAPNATLALHAAVHDQFGAEMAGAITWTLAPGGSGGTLAADGIYTAPAATVAGSDTVHAVSGALDTPLTIGLSGGNLVPHLTSASPQTLFVGSSAHGLMLMGQFSPGTTVSWGSTVLSANIVTASTLTVTIPAALLSTAGDVALTVTAPAPGGGISNALTMHVVIDTVAPEIDVAASGPTTTTDTGEWVNVEASDNAGADGLIYTWSVVSWSGGAASASGVGFTPNGTNSASGTAVLFAHGGTYTLRVTIRDHQGNETISTTAPLTVTATATSILISETTPSVATGATIQLHGAIHDQFGEPLSGTLTWGLIPGGAGGSITASGAFTAPTSEGTTQVQVSDGTHVATVNVAVTRTIPGIVLNGGDDNGGGCGLGGGGLAVLGLSLWLGLHRRR